MKKPARLNASSAAFRAAAERTAKATATDPGLDTAAEVARSGQAYWNAVIQGRGMAVAEKAGQTAVDMRDTERMLKTAARNLRVEAGRKASNRWKFATAGIAGIAGIAGFLVGRQSVSATAETKSAKSKANA